MYITIFNTKICNFGPADCDKIWPILGFLGYRTWKKTYLS